MVGRRDGDDFEFVDPSEVRRGIACDTAPQWLSQRNQRIPMKANTMTYPAQARSAYVSCLLQADATSTCENRGHEGSDRGPCRDGLHNVAEDAGGPEQPEEQQNDKQKWSGGCCVPRPATARSCAITRVATAGPIPRSARPTATAAGRGCWR